MTKLIRVRISQAHIMTERPKQHNVSAAKSAVTDKSMSEIHAARLRGSPVKPIETDRNAAPSKISAIIFVDSVRSI